MRGFSKSSLGGCVQEIAGNLDVPLRRKVAGGGGWGEYSLGVIFTVERGGREILGKKERGGLT